MLPEDRLTVLPHLFCFLLDYWYCSYSSSFNAAFPNSHMACITEMGDGRRKGRKVGGKDEFLVSSHLP